MKDIVYIYDKTDFTRQELGEIQVGFNLSFVIDGTKDSAKISVINFNEQEVEPFSIVKHQATNNWYIVSHDKVERHTNENSYLYVHTLELLGAIDLLTARDLVDSGFNQNRYTIGEFFDRAIKHSNFEFKNNYQIITNDVIDLDKLVDYVKTYENYTPLSALRELIDSYNCSLKLDFEENGSGTIIGAIFTIVSKTGNNYSKVYDETSFNLVQETKTIDKNSFGTTVISNAENVISTKSKTYPSAGSIRLSSNDYKIDGSNAILRLPSAVYKVNYIKMACYPTSIILLDKNNNTYKRILFNPVNDEEIENAISEMHDYVEANYLSETLSWFDAYVNFEYVQNESVFTFYDEPNYDPMAKKFVSSNKKFKYKQYIGQSIPPVYEEWDMALCNKEVRDNTEHPKGIMYYERGKDTIGGFGFFNINNDLQTEMILTLTPLEYDDHLTNHIQIYVGNVELVTSLYDPPIVIYPTYHTLSKCAFVINYIPMSDFKVKLDNSGTRKDSQLYNQNGKLTDSVALSKSLLSYSKEIESDNITKYGTYYATYDQYGNYVSDIPQVGSMVNLNGTTYVINSVSLDFNQNESASNEISYMIQAEFTLSKKIAVKSLMVNPNKNIRDYGIPQSNNVKRKQLYRDFYELSYASDDDSDNDYYLPLDKVLNLGNEYKQYQEHTAIIKITFNGAYGGGESVDSDNDPVTVEPSNVWYYQLEGTTFAMKKTIYEIFDFKDNNIIGYGSQNMWCGFDIKRVFTGMTDVINVPISYVDSIGEFEDIKLCFCTTEQLQQIYDDYETEQADKYPSAYSSFDNSLYNYTMFIPKEIYSGDTYINSSSIEVSYNGAEDSCDFSIEELGYQKDALEVPVFEYSCQIDDSDEVIIGDNILDSFKEDNAYLYSFALAPKNKYNENNYGLLENIEKLEFDLINHVITLNNAVKLEYVSGTIKVTLYENVTFDYLTREITYGTQLEFDTTQDLVIIRHRVLNEDVVYSIVGELYTTNVSADLPLAVGNAWNKCAIKNDDKYYLCKTTTETYFNRLATIDRQSYDYSLYGGANSFVVPPQAYNGCSLAVLVPVEPTHVKLYSTDILQTSNIDNWGITPTTSDTFQIALNDIGYEYLVNTNLPFTFNVASGVQLEVFIGQAMADIVSGTATPSYTYTSGTHTKTFNYVNEIALGIVFKITDIGGGGYRESSITRGTIVSSPDYIEKTIYIPSYGLGHKVYVAGFSGYNYEKWKALFYPATNRVFAYFYSSSSWVRGVEYDSNIHTIGHVINTPTWVEWNSNRWVTFNSWSYHFVEYRSNGIQWQYYGTLDSNNKYLVTAFIGAREYYYNWNSGSNYWQNETRYEWEEIDYANDLYFIYNGVLYQYDDDINQLVQISADMSIDRNDLLFLLRDMENAPIESDELSLVINHYKLT